MDAAEGVRRETKRKRRGEWESERGQGGWNGENVDLLKGFDLSHTHTQVM